MNSFSNSLVPLRSLALSMLLGALPLFAAVKVDLGLADNRKDALSVGWENWAVTNGSAASRAFGGLTVTLRGVGGPLKAEVWKLAVAQGATVAADGVTVRGEGRAAVELEIVGLEAGRHSLVTWHNWLWEKSAPVACDVAVDGKPAVRGLKPAALVTNDFELAHGFVEFTATAASRSSCALRRRARWC